MTGSQKASAVRQTRRSREQHPGELREINAAKREREPVILCIYKIAAVCNGNDLLSRGKAQRWPRLVSVSVCVCDSRGKSGDSDLSDKKKEAKDVSEQRRWHFTERNTCTFSSTGSYSDITFPSTSEPACMCSRSQCMVSLRVGELFISF